MEPDLQALAAARAITEGASSSAFRRGYAGAAAGGSSSASLSAADEEKRETAEVGGDVDSERPSDSRQTELSERELYGRLVDELLEYSHDVVDIEQVSP